MSKIADDEANERSALAYLCEYLPEIRLAIVDLPAPYHELLERIESEARQRRPIATLLRQLVEMNEHGPLRTAPFEMPFGPGHADEERVRCPDRACSRTARPLPAGLRPRCHLTGEPMPWQARG